MSSLTDKMNHAGEQITSSLCRVVLLLAPGSPVSTIVPLTTFSALHRSMRDEHELELPSSSLRRLLVFYQTFIIERRPVGGEDS